MARARTTYSSVLVAIVVAGLAAACGTSAATSGPAPKAGANPPIVTAPQGADALAVWQHFASCMAKRVGLQVTVMPPPHYGIRISGTRPATAAAPSAAQRAAFEARTRAANAACHHFLKPVQTSSTSSQDEARFRDGALRLAQCMRRHGVNVGDPIIKRVVGGFDLTLPSPPGANLAGAHWQAAEKACRSVNPLLNRG